MLTDDTTRLCDEIVALRKARGAMMAELHHGAKGLKHSVTKLCAHFAVFARPWPNGPRMSAWLF